MNTAAKTEDSPPASPLGLIERSQPVENKYFARNPFELNVLQSPPTCKPIK